MKILGYSVAVIGSLALIAAAFFGVKIGQDDLSGGIEVFGFLTGGWGVWLLVKNNIWNWPVGIANAGFFLVLFWTAHFFADSLLQIVYLVAGLAGWYLWLRSGPKKTQRPTTKATRGDYAVAGIIIGVATAIMYPVLTANQDSAPFFDALTTAMSLAAFYLQIKRVYENWWIWIAADIIYIPLYSYKNLYLTSVIYVLFMAMCFIGLKSWKKDLVSVSSLESSSLPI
jgi:nicotinamide mononucleotide transporter